MKKKCNRCGETFYEDENETASTDPNYANVCDDCFFLEENQEPVYEDFSDADNGL